MATSKRRIGAKKKAPAKRKRVRNYAEEYQRRIEHGRERGLSRSQSRGHPKAGELSVKRIWQLTREAKSGSRKQRERARIKLGVERVPMGVMSNELDRGEWIDLQDQLDDLADLLAEFDVSRNEIYHLWFSP